MQISQETLAELQGKHLFGPKPKTSRYLNKLKLDGSQSIDSTMFNDQQEITPLNKKTELSTTKASKIVTPQHKDSKHKKLNSVMQRKGIRTPTTKERSKQIQKISAPSSNRTSPSKGLATAKMVKGKVNKRAVSANISKAKIVPMVNSSKLFLNSVRSGNSVDISEKNKTVKSRQSVVPANSNAKKSRYLNKLAAQNKPNPSQIPEKTKMVVIDLENAEKIIWRKKYEDNGLKYKVTKKNRIPYLNKQSSNSNSYVMYFYLD